MTNEEKLSLALATLRLITDSKKRTAPALRDMAQATLTQIAWDGGSALTIPLTTKEISNA